MHWWCWIRKLESVPQPVPARPENSNTLISLNLLGCSARRLGDLLIEDILSAGHPAMTAIKLHGPHRVFESASARIEVYQPIPSRARRESTPEGPHTHLLPAFIGRRDETLPALPEGTRLQRRPAVLGHLGWSGLGHIDVGFTSM